jgi:hypothetical protein
MGRIRTGKESYRKKKKKIKIFGEKVFVAATAGSHGPRLGNGYVSKASREMVVSAVSIWGGAVRLWLHVIDFHLPIGAPSLRRGPQRWGLGGIRPVQARLNHHPPVEG